MGVELAIGGAAWRDLVFDSPAMRSPKARPGILSRPSYDGVKHTLYGANERVAASILEYFKRLGVVRRWKSAPFVRPTAAGTVWRPTFMAELADDLLLLTIRVKSDRYLTPEVQQELDHETAAAERAGMKQLLWTDKKPLTPAFRELYGLVRRARTVGFDGNDLARLVDFVAVNGSATANQIVEAGHDPALIPVGIRQLALHTRLDSAIDKATVVSVKPLVDGRAFLLMTNFDPQEWWNALEKI